MPLGLFQEVMQDYRDEIKDFFAVDKQLASELEYDMKKYNEQLAQEQELVKQTDVNKEAASATQVDEQTPTSDTPPQAVRHCTQKQGLV